MASGQLAHWELENGQDSAIHQRRMERLAELCPQVKAGRALGGNRIAHERQTAPIVNGGPTISIPYWRANSTWCLSPGSA